MAKRSGKLHYSHIQKHNDVLEKVESQASKPHALGLFSLPADSRCIHFLESHEDFANSRRALLPCMAHNGCITIKRFRMDQYICSFIYNNICISKRRHSVEVRKTKLMKEVYTIRINEETSNI